jgi:DNA-binding winged helix-turn-helix (wHTH) protein/tetratricopeptide (TPR) repeat protein
MKRKASEKKSRYRKPAVECSYQDDSPVQKIVAPRVFRFGKFEYDATARQLRKGGRRIRVPDKPLQVLQLLLERAGTPVSRAEIRENLWNGKVHVEFEDNLNHAVRTLREALADSPGKPRYIETLPRLGYRFIAEVREPNAARSRIHVGQRPVGRAKELAELNAAYASVQEGRGPALFITGEPGMGKTTLAQQFLTAVSSLSGGLVAVGRCSERLAGVEAYLPVLECIDDLLRQDPAPATRELLMQVAPTWYGRFVCHPESPSFAAAAPKAKAASQERMKREFIALLERLCQGRPAILFLDDLQWADTSTVDLVAYVAMRCESMKVMLLGAFRPSDMALASNHFPDVRLELQSRRLYREISIPPLAPEEVNEYIALEFPHHRFDSCFIDLVHRRTQGIPLFVVDLLRDLRESGAIAQQGGGEWIVGRSVEEVHSIPASVRGMVERKIYRLTDEQRLLLEAGSTEGAEFHSSVLADVLGVSTAAVERQLQELERVHRLVEFADDVTLPDGTFTSRYRFIHALYQNSLYAALAPVQQATLSAASAAVLEHSYGGRAREIASKLASMFEAARDWARAADYFLMAADRAVELYANNEAIKLADRAARIAEHLGGTASIRVALESAFKRGFARQTLSDFAGSMEDFSVGEQNAAALGDAAGQVNALCYKAMSASYLKRLDDMRALGGGALGIARDGGITTGAAFAEFILGYERLFAGDLVASREYLTRAVPAILDHPNRLVAGRAMLIRAHLGDFQSEYKQSEPTAIKAHQQFEQHPGAGFDLVHHAWVYGMILGNQGRVTDALVTLSEGAREAELNGEKYMYSRLPNTIGWIHAQIQNFDAAVQWNQQGIAAGRQADTPETEANSCINLAQVYVQLGEYPRAFELLREGERILNREDHKLWLRWRFNMRLRLAMAEYFLATGDADSAVESAKVAGSLAKQTLARKHMAWSTKLMGDAFVAKDTLSVAMRWYRRSLILIGRYPCPILQWRITWAAAIAAASLGLKSDAENLRNLCRKQIHEVASAITDDRLRTTFVRSEAVRKIA